MTPTPPASRIGVEAVVAERVATLPEDAGELVAAYEDLHRLLRDALATLDEV